MTDTEHLKDEHWGELRQKARAALHNLFPHSEAWVQAIRRYIDCLENIAKAGIRVKDELEKIESERDALNEQLSQLKAERDRMAEALGRLTKFFIDAEQQAECLVKTEEETGIGDIKTAFEAVVFNDDGQDFQMWIEYARKVRSALNTGEKTDG